MTVDGAEAAIAAALGAADLPLDLLVHNAGIVRKVRNLGQDFRLSEHAGGLFFTPDGEPVDLRGPSFTFKNIRLYKTCS